MLKSFEAYFDVKSSVSIKHVGWPTLRAVYNVMTARQCQSRSVNRDMEISHGIMQGLPEKKMFTSRFSYIEIFFLEYNSYGICMIARNIICLSWIIVKDQGTGEVVIASYWESTPGGGFLSPKSYVDVPAGPRKSDYLYTNFWPNYQYTIFERKALNLDQIGCPPGINISGK